MKARGTTRQKRKEVKVKKSARLASASLPLVCVVNKFRWRIPSRSSPKRAGPLASNLDWWYQHDRSPPSGEGEGGLTQGKGGTRGELWRAKFCSSFFFFSSWTKRKKKKNWRAQFPRFQGLDLPITRATPRLRCASVAWRRRAGRGGRGRTQCCVAARFRKREATPKSQVLWFLLFLQEVCCNQKLDSDLPPWDTLRRALFAAAHVRACIGVASRRRGGERLE